MGGNFFAQYDPNSVGLIRLAKPLISWAPFLVMEYSNYAEAFNHPLRRFEMLVLNHHSSIGLSKSFAVSIVCGGEHFPDF
jgi:hypothetical protein